MYQDALLPLLKQAEETYDKLFPGGTPADPWPDAGGTSSGLSAETFAQLYAFMALIEPANREAHAKKARTILMYMIEKAHACPEVPTQPYAPFCDPRFPTGNRANFVGEAWGLTVDWLKAADPDGKIFTKADRSMVRDVFLRWANIIADPAAGYPPPPDASGPDLLSNAFGGSAVRQFRQSANNYYSGSMRNLVLMALSVDPAEDPDGALTAYIDYYRDKVLYQQYAMYGDPEAVREDYEIDKLPAEKQASIDVLGLGSGGLSIEGSEYGHSLSYVLMGLLGLHTAGQDDTSKVKQAKLFRSDYWKQFSSGMLASLMYDPTEVSKQLAASPVYTLASYGDMEHCYLADWDYLPMFMALALKDRALSDDAQEAQDLWVAAHAMPGGAANLTTNVTHAFNTSGASTGVLAFMAFDPEVPLSSHPDPRPSLPTTFYAKPLSRILARTGWDSNATLFTHLCQAPSINHVNAACGQFELYRKGEWLTKEVSGYDNHIPAYGHGPEYHNVVGIENDLGNVKKSGLAPEEQAAYERGGQWNNDQNAGDPVSIASGVTEERPYVYVQDDSTNLYNRLPRKNNPSYDSALDVTHASRSLMWLKPDHVVVYDRTTTKSAGHFKRWNMVLEHGDPVISGNRLQTTSQKGQHMFLQAILPVDAKLTMPQFDNVHPVAKLDPMSIPPLCCRLQIESADPAKPADMRFLNVIQGADGNIDAPDVVTLVRSEPTSATAFDGVLVHGPSTTIGKVLVLFPTDGTKIAKGVTVVMPGTVDHVYATGFTPKGSYSVEKGDGKIMISEGGGDTADEAGVLSF